MMACVERKNLCIVTLGVILLACVTASEHDVLRLSEPLTLRNVEYGKRAFKLLIPKCEMCSFEVRVSYPSTKPSMFHFELASSLRGVPEYGSASARTLQNTERFVFVTGSEGEIEVPNHAGGATHIEAGQAPILYVIANPAGVSHQIAPRTLSYSIMVEVLVAGRVPKSALPFVLLVCVSVLLLLPIATYVLQGAFAGSNGDEEERAKYRSKAT